MVRLLPESAPNRPGEGQVNNESTPRFGGLFRFDWGTFDAAAGLKYAIGILVVWWLTEAYGFISFVAGVSTLLAWLTDVPGRRRLPCCL